MSEQAGELTETGTSLTPKEKAALWAAFSSAGTLDGRLATWLRVLATRIPSARAACVYRRALEAADGIALMATWGEVLDGPEMQHSAIQGIDRGIILIRSVSRGFHLIVQPDHYPDWIIVFEVAPVQSGELQTGLQELRWGAGWLVASVEHLASRDNEVRLARLEVVVEVVEQCGRERDLASAAAAVGRAVAAALPPCLVSVGVLRNEVLTLAARIGTDPDASDERDLRREALVRSAITRGGTVLASELPPPGPGVPAMDPDQGPRIAALALPGAVAVAGVLLCERLDGQSFGPAEIATLEQVARAAGPVLEGKPVSRTRPVTRERRALVGLFGPVRLKWKLALLALLAGVLVLLGATGEYRAPVLVTIDGAPPRKVAAPFDGKLMDVRLGVGDSVRRGQVLARYDDTDWQLERVKLTAERDRMGPALREAKEGADPAAVDALTARRKEIEARLAVIDDRLANLQVTSPLDGVIQSSVATNQGRATVRGDDTLFSVAQLDGYRLALDAAAADQSLLREGQNGVARFGEAQVPFVITRLTGGEGGSGPFRVEAQAQKLGPDMAPGVEGVGDVDVGTQKLVWIWWRRLQPEDRRFGGH